MYIYIHIYHIYIYIYIYIIYLHERAGCSSIFCIFLWAATLVVAFRGLRGHRGHVPHDCPMTPCVLYICPRGAWREVKGALVSQKFTKDQWRYDGDMMEI